MAKKPEDKDQAQDQAQKQVTKTKPAKSEKKAVETAAADKPAAAKKTAAKNGGSSKRNPIISRTYFAKEGEVKSAWHIIDANGQTLGRLSSQIATILMGKHKPSFTRSTDTGDFVIVVNAKDVVLTGKKWTDKIYYHHTGYAGGIKSNAAKDIREKHPERLIELAVYRMLPRYKGHMSRHWFKKLKVYAGAEHPHLAQQPQPVKLPH